MIILTRKLIEVGLNNGGISADQLGMFGMTWPPEVGWKDRLEGLEVTEGQYLAFLQLGEERRRKAEAKRWARIAAQESRSLAHSKAQGAEGEAPPASGWSSRCEAP